MSWKVVITARTFEEVGATARELLLRSGCQLEEPPKAGPLEADELLRHLSEADAVLCSPDKYSAAVLGSPEAARLKIISRWGVGYDSIDLGAATREGIVVAYVPGLLNDTVADHTFALLLSVARRVQDGHLVMHGGGWKMLWGHNVHGKTLGIVGCGRIGLAVARRALGFDMKLLGYDVAPCPEAEERGIRRVSLDQLLAASDFVTLHAALTPQSRGLIGEKELRQMKPTAYLINVGRGALIDESALVRALHESWIAGAALDTFTKEPLPADHPFRQAPNILLTPHLASFTRETGQRVSETAAQAIVDLQQGKPPQYVVNPEVFDSPNLRAALG